MVVVRWRLGRFAREKGGVVRRSTSLTLTACSACSIEGSLNASSAALTARSATVDDEPPCAAEPTVGTELVDMAAVAIIVCVGSSNSWC